MIGRIDSKDPTKKKTKKRQKLQAIQIFLSPPYLTIQFHTLLTYQHLRLSLRIDLSQTRE